MHTLRVTYPVLSIHSKTALDHMDDFAIVRDCHRTRLLEGMSNIKLLDDIAVDRRGPFAIDRRNMRASHAYQRRSDLQPGSRFSFFHRARDRL